MANWNIKKKNGQNVMFNDNPRTRTTENYTQNISLAILSGSMMLSNTELLMILKNVMKNL